MLAHRIIPTILCRGRQVVKGEKFKAWRSVGLAIQAIRIHAQRGVDEICILDVTATKENRRPDFRMIEELAESCLSPISVGGGIKTLADIRDLLMAGADKIVIRSHTDLIPQAADKFGSQAIVASVDYIHDRSFREVRTFAGIMPLCMWDNPEQIESYAERLTNDGAGEILLQCINNDGTMSGYDLEGIRRVAARINVPLIASGGCSGAKDAVDAIKAGASAVAIGALFQFTDETPKSVAKYLANHGIETRMPEGVLL